MGQAHFLSALVAASLATSVALPIANEGSLPGGEPPRRATMRREMPVGSLAVDEDSQAPGTTRRLYPAFSSTEMPHGSVHMEKPSTTTTTTSHGPIGPTGSKAGPQAPRPTHSATSSTKPSTTVTTTTKSTTTKRFVEPQTTTLHFDSLPDTLKKVWVVDGCPKNRIRAAEKKDQLVEASGIFPVRCCSEDGKSCGSSFVGCVKSSRAIAEEVCAHKQLRLCKKEEIASNLCCDTGCNFDHELVWAIDPGFEKSEWNKTSTTTTTTPPNPAPTTKHPKHPRPTTTEPCVPVTTPEPCIEVPDTTTKAKP